MDEQVIDDLYNRAISKGYKKSRQEFVRLLHSDGDVINDMYSYVQSKGYKKGVDDFKELIGATIESATSLEPKKKEDTTGLPSGVGSSASSKLADDLRALGIKVEQDESILTKKPREAKIGESKMLAASESTRVPNLRIPQKEQQADELDKKLEQIKKDRLAALSTPSNEEDYFQGTFGDMLRAFDSVSPIGIGDFADDMARAVASGYRSGDVAQAAGKLILSGTTPSMEEIQNLIDKQEKLQQIGSSKEFQDYQKIYEKEGKGVWGFISGISQNPSILPEVMASSIVSMATNTDAVIAALGAIATGATIGASTVGAAGATAGSVVPVAGTAAGGAAGFVSGGISGAVSSLPYAFGLASTILETGSTFAELLQEEVGTDESGNPIKLTQENVRAVLEDPEKYNDIRNKAIARGITIGVIDTFTAKLAAGVGTKILKQSAAKSATGAATKQAVVGATAAGGAIESTFGSLGEAAARGLIGQEMDTGNILLEGIAEMPGSVRSSLTAMLRTPTYKVGKQNVSAQEIDNLIETMTPEQLVASKIVIDNDFEGRKEKMQDKIISGSIAREIKEAQPDLNEPTINAIVVLQKELNKLEGNKTQVAKDRAAQIRADIKNLQENPLPEPIAPTAKPSYKVNGEEVSADVIDNLLKTKSREELLTLNIQISNDTEGRVEKFQEIIQPVKTQEDAVQKQAAGQVPVQPEARVGQEVAQGEPQAEPQGVTQEGQKEIADENVILSGLRDGFKAVTRNSFDIRSDADVMQNIENRKSFTTSVTKNGKKYLVVGLKLKDVEATTSGRDGYSFAAIEDDGNLPSNAVDVLTQKAVSNVSSVYPNIKEPTIDMFAPVEGVRKVQPQVQEEVKPQVKETSESFEGFPVSVVSGNVFHRTNADVSEIKENGFVVPTGGRAKLGYGIYSTISGKETSFGKNEVVGDVEGLRMIDLRNDEFGDKINELQNIGSDGKGGVDFNLLTNKLKENGIDGVITDSEFVVFNPTKIQNVREATVSPTVSPVAPTAPETTLAVSPEPQEEVVTPQQIEELKAKATPKVQVVPTKPIDVEGEVSLLEQLLAQEETAPTQAAGISVSSETDVNDLRNRTQSRSQQAKTQQEKEAVNTRVKIIDTAKKAINTLKSVFPDVDIIIHDDEGSYNAAMADIDGVAGSRGNFFIDTTPDGKTTGRIDINLSKANSRTVAHEIAHGILLKTFGDNKNLFNDFRTRISKVLKADVNQQLNDFANQYVDPATGELLDVNHEEFLAELTGILEQQEANVSVTTMQKIAALINEFVSKITGGKFKPFEDTKNTKDVVDFFNTISGAIREGQSLEGVTEKINPNAEPTGTKVDTSSLKKRSSLIEKLGLERFRDMNQRITEGITLKSLGDIISHLTFSDRLVTGRVGNKDYLGGILFAAATNRVWASFTKGRVSQIISGMPKNEDGYRYLMPALLTEGAHMSNKDMSNTAIKLVEDAISNGDISPVDADSRIRKALNRKGLESFYKLYSDTIGKNKLTPNLVISAIDNAIVKSNSTFEDRNIFLESLLGKADINLKKRFGTLPSYGTLANGLAEPITNGHEFGDILLVIRTKGDLTAVQPKEGDPDYHPSYPWVIRSVNPDGSIADVETLIFDQSYSAVNVFPEVTNKKGQKFTYQKYVDTYGDKAKATYLGYMGARSKMSTSVTEKIAAEAQPKSKVISKSQLAGNEAQRIVNLGRANGLSEQAISTVLQKRGFTQEAIDAALAKAEPAAKKVEVTEEFAPGYNRVLNNMFGEDGVVSKSRKRGVSKEGILENAINYLRGTKVYENATEVQREAMERNVNKELGKREKAAPSAEKVVEGPKKKVTVDEMAALKDQIKLEARAAREAKGDLNTKRKTLAAAINKLAKDGKITAKKAEIIAKRALTINLDSEVAVNKFVDYVSKVFADADYASKLSNGNAIRAKIRSASKNKDKSANLRDLGVKFSEIDPSMVEDIDQYNEIASKILKSIEGSSLRSGVKFAEIVKIADVSDYINTTIDKQRKEILKGKIDEMSELLGIEITEEEYFKIIESINNNEPLPKKYKDKVSDPLKDVQSTASALNEDLINQISNEANIFFPLTEDSRIRIAEAYHKAKADGSNPELVKAVENILSKEVTPIRKAIDRAFNVYYAIIDEILKTGKNPVTGEEVSISDKKKKVVKDFMSMDLNLLSDKEALAAIDSLMNFLQNGSTAKMSAIYNRNLGEKNAIKLDKKGFKSFKLKKYFSPGLAKVLVEQFTQLDLVIERMFKGFTKAGDFMFEAGISALKKGKSLAQSLNNKIVDNYFNTFYKSKPNGQAFNTIFNTVERGMTAYMMRTMPGTEAEINAEFNKKKSLIEQSIANLNKGNDKKKELASVYTEVYDKLVKGSENYDDVVSKADPKNVEAVRFWQNEWANKYEDLSDLSESIYNKTLGRDLNYTPVRVSNTGDGPSIDENSDEMNRYAMSFHINNQTTYQRETGVLMTPTLDDKLSKETFIDLSFDKNNANSMYDALIDLNTADAVRQIAGFFNSDSFENIIQNADDRGILKGRVNLFIRNIRNKTPYDNDQMAKAMRTGLQNLAALGAGRALAGPTQALKQTLPVIMNTISNAGRIDLTVGFNKDKNDFINNSGYAIANRSAASINQIESINKLADKAAKSLPSKIIDPLLQLNELQLKLFLQKPDSYVARASWMSYYEKSLRQQGIDTKSIDYATHQINDKAADYAQRMVDRQQNLSDMDLAGKFVGSKFWLAQFVNKTVMPFSSFRINQSARLGSDWAALTSKVTTDEDRWIAARSLGGFFVEMATFRAMSATIAVVLASIASLISGREDDEEDREKLFDMTIKNATTSSIIDIVSFLPYMDDLFQAGIATSLDVVQDMLEVEDADKFPFYDPKDKSWVEGLGMLGITGERTRDLINLIDVAYTRDYKDDFGRTKYITEEDADILKNFVLLNILSSVGIASPEIKTMTRRTLANVKRRSSTNESGIKREKGSGTRSSGSGAPKTINKTDMKKYFPDMYNELYGPESPTYEVEQEVKAFEKEQRKMEEQIKKEIYGGR